MLPTLHKKRKLFNNVLALAFIDNITKLVYSALQRARRVVKQLHKVRETRFCIMCGVLLKALVTKTQCEPGFLGCRLERDLKTNRDAEKTDEHRDKKTRSALFSPRQRPFLTQMKRTLYQIALLLAQGTNCKFVLHLGERNENRLARFIPQGA